MLLIDSVRAVAFVGLEGLDGVPRLFHRAGHEPADRVSLPAHLFHDLLQRGAVLPLEQGDHLGCLLPSRGPASSAFAAALALGALLAAVAFFLALPLPGAPLAARAPPFAFLSASGLAASTSP